MSLNFVHTIQDELYFEYAKLMSRSTFNGGLNFGFVTDRFNALKAGYINMSGTMREWKQEQELPKECVFCGAKENLKTDHLIPQNRGGSDDPDNHVLTCKTCHVSRNNMGIFAWLGLKKKENLHCLVAGKYIKELFELHTAKGTLSIDADNITKLCINCRNSRVCERNNKVGEITCFCLESVF
jgi:hypothetical protein